ncbi:MAG: hypothetical protein ACKO9Q_15220, partial [Pirellula sp.]
QACGTQKLGEPMTLTEFRRVFRGPLIGNCGYTQATAETAVETFQLGDTALDSWFVFLSIAGLLILQWGLRKRWGVP